MIVAITGGGGFIGTQLVARHLEVGDDVRLLSRSPKSVVKGATVYVGNLSDPSSDFIGFVEGADVLYHCAGEVNNESLMHELHVDGTRRLLAAANGRIGRWIQLSSVGAYGPRREGVVTEFTTESPKGVYEVTKTKADRIIKKSGVPFTILRPSNVFGASMTNQSLFQLVELLRRRLFFFTGPVSALANYVHVDDVVEAMILCGRASRALGQTYIISQALLVQGMMVAFAEGLGVSRSPLRVPEWPVRALANGLSSMPGFPLTNSRIDALTGHCRYDSSKLENQLGYEFSSTLQNQFVHFASSV